MIDPTIQGYTHERMRTRAYDGSTVHVNVDINSNIWNTEMLTNTLAHEIGHTFDLAHCDGCGIRASLMSTKAQNSTSAPACGVDPNSDACYNEAANFTQGKPGPTAQDMSAVAQADPDLENSCSIPTRPPSGASCGGGQIPTIIQGFASDGSAGQRVYECNDPSDPTEETCDVCDPNCGEYDKEACNQPPPTDVVSCFGDPTSCTDGLVPQCQDSGQYARVPTTSIDTSFSGYLIQQSSFNKDQFDSCMSHELSLGLVAQDEDLGRRLGVHGTPTIFVNGEHLPGVRTVAQLEESIEAVQNGKPLPMPTVQQALIAPTCPVPRNRPVTASEGMHP